MRICMITEYFPESERGELRGGVEARTFNLAQQLAERHAVTVVTSYESGGPRTHAIGNVTVIRCGKHRYTHSGAFLSRLRFACSVMRVLPTLRAHPPDIIEGENFLCYLPAYALARKLGAKAIATYHEVWLGDWVQNKGLMTGLFGSIWERMALRKRWDRIIAVSAFTKHKLVAAGITPEKISVVPNGVDLAAYPTAELMPHKYAMPTICCIARLTKTKHLEDILDAMAKLKQHATLRLKILGTGDEERALRKRAARLGIANRVEFLGFLHSHAQLIEVLARSHLLCSASTVEGFGITVLEAMACGIPYVISRIPPHREITGNSKGGMLFKPRDIDDLAEKIDFLLTRKIEYDRRSRDGRAHAQQYAWKKIAAQLEAVYAR